MKKEVKSFIKFFAEQEPQKIISALKLINDINEKSIEELELSIKLTKNPKIKEILKSVMRMKIDKL